mmetsp:Transcript_12201/g.36790  ORF Transcript_12201/g.36790 Transcript_12201/m.36790 type:complete len:280 (-) Transcript_12201:311-1150(-)
MAAVICEKSKTRWPPALNRGSMPSSKRNLPEHRIIVSSMRYASDRNRYGWLQHFRSCISTLFRPRWWFRMLLVASPFWSWCDSLPCESGWESSIKASSSTAGSVRPPFVRASLAAMRACCICSYSTFCQGERSQRTTFSIFSGSWPSTEALTRRSTKGRRTSWSRLMTSMRSSLLMLAAFSASFRPAAPNCEKGLLNQPSNESQLEKIDGSKKFSNAHSSGSEFWSGVPVSKSRRFAVYRFPSVCANLEFAFFMRWPSSTMMYCHSTFRNTARSRMMYS